MKVVINRCYGGFSLSKAATLRLREMGNDEAIDAVVEGEVWPDTNRVSTSGSSLRNIPRDHVDLVAVVEELGDDANGDCAKLHIVEIPDDVEWTIEEYDGIEWVSEVHRTWG